ncbi:hypothetical protein QEH44_gp45 [Arthrobacter phage Shambre1]|uniref:Uncharacterized protein n=1 Tax=Arthrobacter phage Shambre1 TaxID=2927284 RepID=A0A977PT21_9CAUD|nr:hypothetical protein QEH44_gp45 [Arthrobacter phage Shambre1]UXE04781.1 hypothetical protein SEA_SHAMBRE1_45 [Arthrobacter phage Shambre1]
MPTFTVTVNRGARLTPETLQDALQELHDADVPGDAGLTVSGDGTRGMSVGFALQAKWKSGPKPAPTEAAAAACAGWCTRTAPHTGECEPPSAMGGDEQ